jgi:hypothetical protein
MFGDVLKKRINHKQIQGKQRALGEEWKGYLHLFLYTQHTMVKIIIVTSNSIQPDITSKNTEKEIWVYIGIKHL